MVWEGQDRTFCNLGKRQEPAAASPQEVWLDLRVDFELPL
jgi:hypothetical protein